MMSDLYFAAGMNSFTFARITRELDSRDRDVAAAKAAGEIVDQSVRFTAADPNCIDHPLPSGGQHEPPLTHTPGVVYDLQTGKPKN